MSVLAAILLTAQAAAPAADPAPSSEIENTIIVSAERMRSIEVNVGQDREGTWHCSLSGSTGSAWVDDRLCRITTGCVRDADSDRVERCVTRRRASIINEFREALERGEA
ncbi:hypothetical protein [Aurantiacibacter hainanensis]|uniref:hypothetical protein n=1 Tax=Aurantiacibacter hainanensis TaxID=3076114 RepID=UPI0030C76B44